MPRLAKKEREEKQIKDKATERMGGGGGCLKLHGKQLPDLKEN